MKNYVLEIQLKSPLTSAAGEGRVGLVDRDVVFDGLGLPILPGRRLKGLWREAYRDVTEAWQQCGQDTICVGQIFGESGQGPGDGDACIHIANAKLKNTSSLEKWLEYLQHDKVMKLHADDVLQHFATVRAQTAVDRQTAAAKENTLRLMRTLKSGLVFWARVRFVESPPNPALLNALALGAVALQHIGTARTRGLGKVRCCLLELDANGNTKDLTPALNQTELPSISIPVFTQSDLSSTGQQSITTPPTGVSPIHMLRYRFNLTTATIIPVSDGDPNTVVSRQDIPGSHLWGIAAWCYLNEENHTEADTIFRETFLEGGLRFLAAYPEAVDTHQRLIPIPHSIRKSKTDERPYDLVVNGRPQDKPVKRLDQRYAKFDLGGIETQSVKTERNYHHARAANDRRKGRALGVEVPDGGALFTYQAIQPNQTFQGAVLGSENDLKQLKKWVQSPKAIHMGRSRSAQYGEAKFEWIDDTPRELNSVEVEWNGFTTSEPPTNLKTRLIITTLSPLLTVNENGHPDTCFPVHELVNALGLDISALKLISSFTRTETISGYHTHLRLPRQQGQAIAAGSVFEFKLDQTLTGEKLSELEHKSLGLRKGEGFGRIAVNRQNNPCLEEKQLDDPDSAKLPDIPDAEIHSDLLQILKQVVRTYCVEEMEKYAREIADQLAAKHKIPRNALLGRLRLFLRHENPVENLEKLRKPAKEQLTNFQIDMRECNLFELPNRQTLFDIFKKAWLQRELFTENLIKDKVQQLADDFNDEIRKNMIRTLVENDSTKLCNDFLDYLITALHISRRHTLKQQQ